MSREHLSLTQKRIFTVIILICVAAFTAFICYYIGKPMIQFVSDPKKFRDFVDSRGMLGKIIFIGMVVFQTVIAIVPGEPFEVVAGYAFGVVEGSILCLIGALIGSLIIFALVRSIGIKAIEVFFSVEKIRSLKFLQNSKRLNIITFVVFIIPGTPKDLLSYFVGLTEMKLSTWIIISTVARIPSVVSSTAGGDALGVKKYSLAVIIFAVTVVLSLIGVFCYNKFFANEKSEKSD